jgi:hypothetical protein
VVIDMQDKPAPEYIHLFNAITKTIESLQELLIIQLIAKDAVEGENIPVQTLNFLHRTFDEHIAALQVLQVFLMAAQQKAEDIFLDRSE